MGYTPPQLEIDVGNVAINRGSTAGVGYTYIDKANPANASGNLTTVEIWAATNMTNVVVATFYVVSGDNFSTRDYENIGEVTAGAKVTKTVDITVEAGDFIGLMFSSGSLEMDTSGGVSGYYKVGGYIPCTNQLFTLYGTIMLSLYGKKTGSGQLTIGDSFSIVDSNITKITKALSEAFSVVDGKITKIIKALGEAFSIVDSFAHTIILHFYEVLSVKDTFTTYLLSLWHKVTKEIAEFTKVEKEKDDWDKVDKEEGNWDKTDKE